jgi:hypothetical protein
MPAPGVFMPARMSTVLVEESVCRSDFTLPIGPSVCIFSRVFQLHAEDFIRVYRVKALMFIR